MKTKGIILAGGSGTRLHPVTRSVSKQLMPIYDKPMVYYPLCTLMLAGITELLVITRPEELVLFEKLLSDGAQWGISITYATQDKPRGIADAFIVGERFLDGSPAMLVLGDNIFYGEGFGRTIRRAVDVKNGAVIFPYYVDDPKHYGVAEFDTEGRVVGLEEKPEKPKSSYAITGLYCYDGGVCEVARAIKPSARGELEITAINQWYLAQNKLRAEILGRGVAWLDTGTHAGLLEASNFVASIERRQGLKIAAPEEIAYRQKLIDEPQLMRLAEEMSKTEYGQYLLRIVREEKRYFSE